MLRQLLSAAYGCFNPLTTILQSFLTHFTIISTTGLAVFAVIMITTFLYNTFVYPFYVSPTRHFAGPKDNAFFIGQTPKFFETTWIPHLYAKWSREWPDAPFIRYLGFGNHETIFVSGIQAYKEILQTKSAHFVKPHWARTFAHETIGDGLPFVEGTLHKQRRQALMEIFSIPHLKATLPMVQKKAKQWVNLLRRRAQEDGTFEIEPTIWQSITDVIGIVTFGQDFDHLESNRSPLSENFTKLMQPSYFGHIVNYFNAVIPIRKYMPIHELEEYTHSGTTARDFIRVHVEARLEALERGVAKASNPNDALQVLVEHSDPSWGEREIIEYAVNLMILGSDTTACAVTWAVDVLSRHPQLQQRLRDEINSLNGSDDDSHDGIDKLPLLNNFIREVLRLYCAVSIIPRMATCDIEIAGVFLPKGTVLHLSPAVMNLHPTVWGPDAAEFDADRWDNLTGAAASPYAFETFHNGPRMCIGKQLTLNEMKAMVVELVSQFRVEALSEEPLENASPSFTLRPKEKLVVKLTEL
ncbi:cytochrome P450 [Dactylonectria estremocensis]|uniref:Cytochrome P450 n=1 Tax=Dactylonectria estremocensis TaxID=1079267 RepID=A0A9P9F379_9HYPO|nr:cytochrome P450 [Dactylonectria estremocensis]